MSDKLVASSEAAEEFALDERRSKDVEILRVHLEELQRKCFLLENLCPSDFGPTDDRLPTTSEVEESCARIADGLDDRFDGNIFRHLYLEDASESLDKSLRRIRRRIEMLPRIIAEIEAPPDELVEKLCALTGTEYAILRQLLNDKPQQVKITDLAVDLNSHRNTVGDAIRRLESLNLVKRPKGPRSGVTITDSGVSHLRPCDRPAPA